MSPESPYRHFSSFLLISYVIVVSILLLNLLIAMMGNTFQKVNEEARKHWLLQRCRTIFAIQDEMSKEELQNVEYFIMIGDKRCLDFELDDPMHFKKKLCWQ